MSRRARPLLAAGALVVIVVAAAVVLSWWSREQVDMEAALLASLVELRPGMTVADVGAGRGAIAIRMAARLGPAGRLYATEIGAAKLEALRRAAAAAGAANIEVLEAGEHSTRLPEACCDVIYLRRVYHHLSDAQAVNKSLYASLRPGGRLAVIDMLAPRWLFFLHHGIASSTVAGDLTAAGFVLERRIDRWSPIDYCLIFRKR